MYDDCLCLSCAKAGARSAKAFFTNLESVSPVVEITKATNDKMPVLKKKKEQTLGCDKLCLESTKILIIGLFLKIFNDIISISIPRKKTSAYSLIILCTECA